MGGNKLLTLQSNRRTTPGSDMALAPEEDHRHILEPGEHEAFYFPFTSPDGNVFGFMRTLFDQATVLEMMALHIGGRVWVHQQRTPLPDGQVTATDASGPSVTLTCRKPWQAWRCVFHSTARQVDGEKALPAKLDLEFAATGPPARYGYGPYQQAQQDGRLCGRLQVAAEKWMGELLCYRDHSWGQRPMGAAAAWTIASAPDYFYVVIVEMGDQQVYFGRITASDGKFIPVHTPQFAALGDGWELQDPDAGMRTWHVKRLASPLVFYLGPAGEEAIRDAPRPGDLYVDTLGPALFISPEGERIVGLVEQARRLK
jgi:hypothetical protein